MELKQRAQMDPAYQWDLTAIYENDAAWERAMEKAAEAVKELKGLPGTLGASAQALADGLDKIYAQARLWSGHTFMPRCAATATTAMPAGRR